MRYFVYVYSYNGVIFDVESCGPFEVDLLSLSVAGMLGRVVSISNLNMTIE